MAGSMYAYVRNFELPDPVLPSTFIVVRIDGKGFHKFSETHGFVKPNDGRALELMNAAARHVMLDVRPEIALAFGESDEYSFLFRRSCSLYKRRASKLVTHIVSLFTSAYVFLWPRFLPNVPLAYPPSFDGRLIAYPTEKQVKDYFAWRQADTHINNLYNTTFWALVQQAGQSEREAHETLRGTVSAEKNEILFSKFDTNYDKLPAMFRKGSTLVWDTSPSTMTSDSEEPQQGRQKTRQKASLRTLHVDIIGKSFWSDEKRDMTNRIPEATATSDGRTAEAWEDRERVVNFVGLGKEALEA